jgi:hypothetical protein
MPRHWTKNTGGGASPSPPPKERTPSGAKGATPAAGLLCELADAAGAVVHADHHDRRAGLLAPLLLCEEKAEKEKDKKEGKTGLCRREDAPSPAGRRRRGTPFSSQPPPRGTEKRGAGELGLLLAVAPSSASEPGTGTAMATGSAARERARESNGTVARQWLGFHGSARSGRFPPARGAVSRPIGSDG